MASQEAYIKVGGSLALRCYHPRHVCCLCAQSQGGGLRWLTYHSCPGPSYLAQCRCEGYLISKTGVPIHILEQCTIQAGSKRSPCQLTAGNRCGLDGEGFLKQLPTLAPDCCSVARLQGVSAWNFDVAALKEQAQREGGLDAVLPTISEAGDGPPALPQPTSHPEPSASTAPAAMTYPSLLACCCKNGLPPAFLHAAARTDCHQHCIRW